jgi:Rod binding domain-containing protein
MNGIDFSSVANPATTAPDGGQHLKLKKSAQDFEGMLLGSLWKSVGDEMKESFEGDSAAGSFVDMGVQAVGNAMAKQGGVGIASMILKKLEKAQPSEIEGHGPK